MSVWGIFWLFVKISVLTFGGGYAMIPLFQSELVEKFGLIGNSEFANMVALAQMTPGPVGLNSATYIGFQQSGFLGALAGTIGVVMPSLLLVTLVIFYFNKAKEHPLVLGIMSGIRPATLGLIFASVLFFAETSVFTAPIKNLFVKAVPPFGVSVFSALIFTTVLILNLKTKINIIYLIAGSAGLGIVAFGLKIPIF